MTRVTEHATDGHDTRHGRPRHGRHATDDTPRTVTTRATEHATDGHDAHHGTRHGRSQHAPRTTTATRRTITPCLRTWMLHRSSPPDQAHHRRRHPLPSRHQHRRVIVACAPRDDANYSTP